MSCSRQNASRATGQPAGLCAKGGPHAPDGTVDVLIEVEKQLGLDRSSTLREFGARIDGLRDRFKTQLNTLTNEGLSIAGYGAPAKATTLLHHFGIEPGTLEYIIDDSPLKQGLYSPGQHIPVLPSDILRENPPDILVILAWNFADIIMRKQRGVHGTGRQILVPVPDAVVSLNPIPSQRRQAFFPMGYE